MSDDQQQGYQQTFNSSVTRDIHYLKEQVDGLRRLVDQLIQKSTMYDENFGDIKDEKEKFADKYNADKEELTRKFFEIEKTVSAINSRKDIVPGISVSSLLALLTLLGSGVTGYVVLKEDVAVERRTIGTIEKDIEEIKANHKEGRKTVLSDARDYVDNMLRINNLQNTNEGAALKLAVEDLKVSIKLLERTSIEKSSGFSDDLNRSIDNLRDLESRLNATISTVEGLRTQIKTLKHKTDSTP